jgi:hypothetical protein
VSTATEVLLRENERSTLEVQELRLRAPPLPPRLDELRPGQEVTEQQLAALHRAQRSGALKFKDDQLVEVFTTDRVGRRVKHFFGDPAAVWDGAPTALGRVPSLPSHLRRAQAQAKPQAQGRKDFRITIGSWIALFCILTRLSTAPNIHARR